MTSLEEPVEYTNIFELLEAVRQYELRPKEAIIPLNSVNGSVLGYATAHPEFRSVEWAITRRAAKNTAAARGTRESLRIRDLLANSVGRKQLLQELREGTLEYGIAHHPEPPAATSKPAPRQRTIPGL